MPTAITLASPAAFTNPIFKPLPVISNLSAWIYFGGSLAQSTNAGTVGNPALGLGATQVFSPGYVSLHGMQGSLVLPAFSPAATMTWMGVVRYTAGGTGGASGTLLTNPSGTGGLILGLTATTLSLTAGGISSPTALTIAANGGNNWKFYAFTASAGGVHMFYNESDSTSQQIVATGTLAPTANNPYGIGGIGSGTPGSNDRGTDHAFLCWAQSLVSKPSIDQVYAHVKDVMAGKGIVI